MPCECENITCLEVFYNPCSEGANIGLASTYTGNITGIIEFNGILRAFAVGVVLGDDIIIPADSLNENYKHTLKMYVSGSLYNDTCYTLKSKAVYDSPTFAVVPTENFRVFEYEVTATDGSTINDPEFGTGEVLLLNTDAQSYGPPFFTQSGEDITSTGQISFYVGQIIIVTLKLD